MPPAVVAQRPVGALCSGTFRASFERMFQVYIETTLNLPHRQGKPLPPRNSTGPSFPPQGVQPMRIRWSIALALALIPALAAANPKSKIQNSKSLDFYFVDVEGGAATLIVTPAGESVLIDCGAPGDRDAERIAHAAKVA